MQQNVVMNMQQQPNLTFYTTPHWNEAIEETFSDLDAVYSSLDETIEGAAADNFSDLYCPSFSYQNITYLNVSCDTALDFSVPLYGER